MDDAALAGLVAADYQAYVDAYADTPGVVVRRSHGIRMRWSDAVEDDYLDGVFGTVIGDEDDAEARIREAIDTVGRRGRAFHWSVWPNDVPSDLTERLIAAGLEFAGTNPAMVLDLVDLGPAETPPGLVIREATDEASRIAIAEFATKSVGWIADGRPNPFAATFVRLAEEPSPRMRLFGGWLDGVLVSSSELFTGSGVAGIYAVATDEAMRGRGFGRALTLATLHAGREAGHRLGVLMASDLGLPVYRRLGFRDVGTVSFLRWPGGLPSANAVVR
jgi:GNAT superfamily N-acetyltransferase